MKMNFMKGFIATTLLVIGSNAFAAANTPLGNGTIDGTVNKVATLQLTPTLNSQYVYDITCTIADPTGDKMPAVVRIDNDAYRLPNNQFYVLFDGKPSNTSQVKLSDTNTHTLAVMNLTPALDMSGDNVHLILTWLAGDDVSTPITYDCSAAPSVSK